MNISKKMLKQASKSALGTGAKMVADYSQPICLLAFDHSKFYEWMQMEFPFREKGNTIELTDLEDYSLFYNTESEMWELNSYDDVDNHMESEVYKLFSFKSKTQKMRTLIYQVYVEIFHCYLALFDMEEEFDKKQPKEVDIAEDELDLGLPFSQNQKL